MKIIRYAGLEYKHNSKPTHLYHVEREGLHYLLYYKGGGSLSYDAKMSGTPAEVDAAFDQEVEFMGSGAYHSEKWNVATETPDAHAEKILEIFEHPTFGIKWEKTGGGQSSEDQFCDMLEEQVKEWKGRAHALPVAKHPYWPKFHAMVVDAVTKEYGNSIRLYRGIRGEQAISILNGEPSKNRGATAWTSDLSSARVYAAGKTKRGNTDWVVVQRNFSPEEILLAPVKLDGPCKNPDILLPLIRDVEHAGDELIVQLDSFVPGDFKIVARPRGMKSESLLREYIRRLLECGEELAMQPIMDPLFNMREMCKEFTLLEDHLNQPDMQCHDCINKHLMKCEALAEEAISLDKENQYPFIVKVPNVIRRWHEHVLSGGSLEDLASAIRPVRKKLTPLVADRFET